MTSSLFLFRFFLIHTVTQMETTIQLISTPVLRLATAMIKFVSDKSSGKRDEDDEPAPLKVTVTCIIVNTCTYVCAYICTYVCILFYNNVCK